jgi:ATP-dependent Clp protease protease subunit
VDVYDQYTQYQRYRQMSLDDMLLENRIVFLIGDINYGRAAEVIMKLLYLDNMKRGREISLYINSPGGTVDDTMAIYDTMQFVGSPIATYCIGRAQSGGAVILAAGAKGSRYALPHAKIMLHQPWGGVTGQASDIQIQAEEILRAKQTINRILPSTRPAHRADHRGDRAGPLHGRESQAVRPDRRGPPRGRRSPKRKRKTSSRFTIAITMSDWPRVRRHRANRKSRIENQKSEWEYIDAHGRNLCTDCD